MRRTYLISAILLFLGLAGCANNSNKLCAEETDSHSVVATNSTVEFEENTEDHESEGGTEPVSESVGIGNQVPFSPTTECTAPVAGEVTQPTVSTSNDNESEAETMMPTSPIEPGNEEAWGGGEV